MQPTTSHITDVTMANFREAVINASMNTPVLVDFWAPWCGPCKQLTPIIERQVNAQGGKVKLAKMNIDDHPQIAGQLGVQSIPAVFAFVGGQPVDAFMGAVPEGQIKEFIERLLSPPNGDLSQIPELLEQADALRANADYEAASELYAAVLAEEPENATALAGFAHVQIDTGNFEQAQRLLEAIPAEKQKEAIVQKARVALELAEQAAKLGDIKELEAKVEANPLDHQARFDLALAYNARNKREEAADELLAIIRKNRQWNNEAARVQLLQFFEAWGLTDPATIAARRRLSSLLFS